MAAETDNLMKKATERENEKKYRKVIKCCDEILEIDPTCYSLYSIKGKSYFMLNDYDNSLKYFKKYLTHNQNNEDMIKALNYICSNYFFKHDYENALKYADESLKLDSAHEPTLKKKANILIELERFDDALALADELENTEILADIHYEMDDYETAAKLYDKLMEDSEDYADYLDFKEMKAKSLFQNEDYEEFLKLAEELVNISPNKSIYISMSIAYHKMEDYDNMAKYLELSARYDPSIKNELLNAAKENLALKYNENSINDNIAMGSAYMSDNQPKKALKYFLKANELKKDDEEILKMLAKAYYLLCDYDNEYDILKKLLEINPENYDVMIELAYACSNIDKPIEVIELGNKLIAEDSKYDSVYTLIAKAYLELKDKENAFKCIDEAINLHPNTNYFISYKGLLYLMTGDEKSSKECFKKALNTKPNDPLPYLTQINFYEENENYKKVKEIYEKLIADFPDFKGVKRNVC